MKDRSPPLVSIVVTTKDEERNIETCLRSLAAQTYAPIEIIVVDNASTDRTKELARKFTDNVFDVGPERSAQRNFGILKAARGDYVMYLDADMILSPDLVSACVRRMGRGDCVALYIPEIVLGTSLFSRIRRFERTFYDGTIIDAARFGRRQVFVDVSGFDEAMTGVEDWDFDKKLRGIGRIALLASHSSAGSAESVRGWELEGFVRERGVPAEAHPGVVFHNESTMRLLPYLRKKAYYAGWFQPYVEKWGRRDPDVRRQLGLVYRLVVVFFEGSKWKRLVSHPVLAAAMYGLRGLVAAAAVARWRTGGSQGDGRGLLELGRTRKLVSQEPVRAAAIDRYAEAHPQFGGSREITPLLAAALAATPDEHRVLDVGCGEGGTLPALRDAGRRDLIGCELSDRRARITQERGFDVVLGDALLLPITDASVGLTLVRHVIEHVEDDLQLLREVSRVLAPGGRIYLETPLRLRGAWYPYRNPSGEWMLDPTHLREYREVDELLDLFEGAALGVVSWHLRRIRFPIVHGLYRAFPRLARRTVAGLRSGGLTIPVPRYREIQVVGQRALGVRPFPTTTSVERER